MLVLYFLYNDQDIYVYELGNTNGNVLSESVWGDILSAKNIGVYESTCLLDADLHEHCT